jgi:hypothetical protein
MAKLDAAFPRLKVVAVNFLLDPHSGKDDLLAFHFIKEGLRQNARAHVAANGTLLNKVSAIKNGYVNAEPVLLCKFQGKMGKETPRRTAANNYNTRTISQLKIHCHG